MKYLQERCDTLVMIVLVNCFVQDLEMLRYQSWDIMNSIFQSCVNNSNIQETGTPDAEVPEISNGEKAEDKQGEDTAADG